DGSQIEEQQIAIIAGDGDHEEAHGESKRAGEKRRNSKIGSSRARNQYKYQNGSQNGIGHMRENGRAHEVRRITGERPILRAESLAETEFAQVLWRSIKPRVIGVALDQIGCEKQPEKDFGTYSEVRAGIFEKR